MLLGAASRADTLALWTFDQNLPPTWGLTSGLTASDAGPFAPELGTGAASAHHLSFATYSAPAGSNSTYRSLNSTRWAVGDYYQFTTSSAGYQDLAIAFDVTNSESVNEAVEFVERDIGPIDILVNNAGMQFRAPLEEFPEDKFERIMSANVTSVYLVGQAVAKRMIPRGAGKIVNICSLMSAVARPSIAPYAASKAAVANLTRAMATEWARHGLNVNVIAPGYFKTELNEALVKDPEFSAWIGRRTPMGRWGEVAELGGAAIFLSSDAASFVNGHILYVDGAFMATV